MPRLSLPPKSNTKGTACQDCGNRAVHNNPSPKLLWSHQIHRKNSLQGVIGCMIIQFAQLTAMKLPGRYASVIKAATFVVLESFLAICATSRITLLSIAVSPVDVTMLPMSRRLPAVRSTDLSLSIFSNFGLFSHAFWRQETFRVVPALIDSVSLREENQSYSRTTGLEEEAVVLEQAHRSARVSSQGLVPSIEA